MKNVIFAIIIIALHACTPSNDCNTPKYIVRTEYGTYETCNYIISSESILFREFETGKKMRASLYQLEEK